jgi:hypothetical protein
MRNIHSQYFQGGDRILMKSMLFIMKHSILPTQHNTQKSEALNYKTTIEYISSFIFLLY